VRGALIRAIIFDCDGVLVDSEPSHFESFRLALESVGIDLAERDYYERYIAYDDEALFRAVFADLDRELTGDLLGALLERKRSDLGCRLEELPALAATCEFANHVLDEGYRVAVASGARRIEVTGVLERADLLDDVEILVTAEDVERGKPDPEPYLTALARLNDDPGRCPLKPEECLVIEDAGIGVRSGRAAGMWVVALTSTYPAEALAEAHLVLPDLAGITLVGIEDRILAAGGES